MQRYYSKCPYFRRTHRGLADGDPWLATVSSLRISPSVGMVRSCPLAGCTLLEMLSRPEDFVSDVKAGQTTPKDEEQGSVEQSHFASTAGLLVGHGLGTVLGRQAGERRRKDRACFVTAFGWFSSAEYDAVRRCRVVPGGGILHVEVSRRRLHVTLVVVVGVFPEGMGMGDGVSDYVYCPVGSLPV